MAEEIHHKKENFLKRYVRESWQELLHVTWPTKNQAINICILVVVFVFISSLLIAGVDFLFNKGYAYLLTLR